MDKTNYTIFHLLRYHIELIEALEYSLMTHKIDKLELHTRMKFLKQDYKKGFFNLICKHLSLDKNEEAKELKYFLKKYSSKSILKISDISKDYLSKRIEFNKDLYLATSNTASIISDMLDVTEIKEKLDAKLINLFDISNEYFYISFLFNSVNIYTSSKVKLLKESLIYSLTKEDNDVLTNLLSSLQDEVNEKTLLDESMNLLTEKKKFNEEEAYELLNKISFAHNKLESSLYTNFQNLSNKLEKEIEKGSN